MNPPASRPRLPNKVSPGDAIRATEWNALVDFIAATVIGGGVGYTLSRQGKNGTTLNINQSAVQGVTEAAWPFKVYDATANGVTQVIVNSGDGFVGTIRDQAARINGTPISTPPAGSTAPLLATPSSGYIYIQVYLNPDGSLDTSGGGGSGVDILWSASAPTPLDPASPPTYATQLIAENTVNGTSQSVDNATNYGFTNFNLCTGDGGFY